MNEKEFLIFEALNYQSELNVNQAISVLGKKTIFPILKGLLEKEAITIKERIYEQYKPKLIKYVKINPIYTSEKLNDLLEKFNLI